MKKLDMYIDNILDIYEGDYELTLALCQDLIDMFKKDFFEVIQDMIIKQDGQGITKLAHKLKGAVSNFNMKDLKNYLLELEKMGREYKFDRCTESIEKIREEVKKFEHELNEYSQKKSVN